MMFMSHLGRQGEFPNLPPLVLKARAPQQFHLLHKYVYTHRCASLLPRLLPPFNVQY